MCQELLPRVSMLACVFTSCLVPRISRDWPRFLSPAGEKALINSRVDLPFRTGAPPRARASTFPTPGAIPRGGTWRQCPAAQPPAAQGALWLLTRAQAEVFWKAQRIWGCRALSSRHYAVQGDQGSVAKSYSVESRSPPCAFFGGKPTVTRQPPKHLCVLFSPREGLSGGKETLADF